MNDKFTNTTDDENVGISKFLTDMAEQTNANPHFVAELEQRLKANHQPKRGWSFTMFKNILPALGWVALATVFVFLFSWSIRNLIPDEQPSMDITSTPGFVCPVTAPNGSTPPGENPSEYYLGNNGLWTVLWSDGKVILTILDRNEDGSFSMKWGWWRGNSGSLTIEGHRLDAQAEPLRADIPEGYGDTGFQVSALIFPATGCWEVTGHVGESSLTFVTEVLFNGGTPTPSGESLPTPQVDTTPIPNETGYDWRETKLYLNAPLPDTPAQANIYLLKDDDPATVEQARALAGQLGLQGQVYMAKNLSTGATEPFVTDGKQSLSMSSRRFFTYTADMSKAVNFLGGTDHPNAEATINDFLLSHGFDFPHKITKGDVFGGYLVDPLSPDGIPMRYEFFSSRPMRVILDEDGQVLQIEANLMDYESAGAQTYDIITAEEAFQKMMDDTITAGKIESALSASIMETKQWIRDYPANETTTIYGYSSSVPALDPSQPAFTQIDGFTVTGNSSGMELLERNTFVEATGQFINENGIDKFTVESWQISESIQDGLVGTLTYENGQVIFQTEEGEQLIIQPDLPADLPIPFENAFVVGVRKGNTYNWSLVDNRMSGGGGGGGGGGQGFYKLNFSGTPVPFPPPQPTPGFGEGNYTVQNGDTLTSIAQAHDMTVDELMRANGMTDSIIFVDQQLIIPGAGNVQSDVGQKIEGQRGLMNITIYNQPNGGQRVDYLLSYMPENAPYPSMMILEGDNLQELQAYQNRPVEIWGTVDRYDERYGMPVVRVERFQIPFPDLQIQILRGTQKVIDINGQPAVLFTTEDGTSYIQSLPGADVTTSLLGKEGDPVILEAIAIPDEIVEGYPTLRVFGSALAISPKNGQPIELTVSADQIYTYDEVEDTSGLYTPPTLTIEKVDLMYFVTNPNWQVGHLDGSPHYLQPVWHFYGHYDNGITFDLIVQALKQEYLLPELDPYIQGG